jgi:hypothetical protein
MILRQFCRPLDSAAQGGFAAPSVPLTPLGPIRDGKFLGPDLNPRLPNVNSSARSIVMLGILLYAGCIVDPLRIEINLNYITDFSFYRALSMLRPCYEHQ